MIFFLLMTRPPPVSTRTNPLFPYTAAFRSAGEVAEFDKELQETMRGPAGADIRRDHLREHIADHLFNGDYDNATRVMGLPYAALGGLTIYEAAATHDGMLQVKTLVAKLEGGGFPEGAWSEDER